MWQNQFSQLLNVQWLSDLRQTDIDTTEQTVLQPNAFVVEMAIEN